MSSCGALVFLPAISIAYLKSQGTASTPTTKSRTNELARNSKACNGSSSLFMESATMDIGRARWLHTSAVMRVSTPSPAVASHHHMDSFRWAHLSCRPSEDSAQNGCWISTCKPAPFIPGPSSHSSAIVMERTCWQTRSRPVPRSSSTPSFSLAVSFRPDFRGARSLPATRGRADKLGALRTTSQRAIGLSHPSLASCNGYPGST